MTALPPGARLGDWVVEKPLGAGGMGSVYRCHSALSEDVRAAVKVLTDATSTELRQRFVQELRTLHGLSHPGIVRVLGGGTDDARGLMFLAMELVDGESLEDRLRRGPMSTAQATAAFATIADALAHAHARGVFHRDVKPANVMLRRDGGAVLVDFGIAISRDRTRVTREGMLPGTLAYLPPETFQGELPDPRSTDAYALGITFFEALTGASAFPVSDHGSDGQRLAQITGQKMRAEALDPGDDVPAPAREAIRRTTDPEPETRLTDLGQVRDLLAPGAAAHRPTNDTWDLPVAPPRPRPRRRLGLVVGLALVGLTLAVGATAVVGLGVAAGVGWYALQPTPAAPRARPRVDLAEALRDGARALEAGDVADARHLAGLALDAHPEDPHANLLYGQALAADDDVALARPYLCAALRGGVDADLGVDPTALRCDPGPGAVTPLADPLAVAKIDLGPAVADLGDVSDAAPEPAAAPARARSASSAPRPAMKSMEADDLPPIAAAPQEAEEAAPVMDRKVAAAKGPPPAPPPPAEPVSRSAPAGGAAPAPAPDASRPREIQAKLAGDAGLETCWQGALARTDVSEATLRIRLSIRADGTVAGARIESATGADEALSRCVLARIRALTFPRGDAPIEVVLPLRFVAG